MAPYGPQNIRLISQRVCSIFLILIPPLNYIPGNWRMQRICICWVFLCWIRTIFHGSIRFVLLKFVMIHNLPFYSPLLYPSTSWLIKPDLVVTKKLHNSLLKVELSPLNMPESLLEHRVLVRKNGVGRKDRRKSRGRVTGFASRYSDFLSVLLIGSSVTVKISLDVLPVIAVEIWEERTQLR